MKKEGNGTGLRRTIALALACVLVFGFALARLFDYQIVNGEYYASLAESASASTVAISAARGEIVDRNGVPLTQNKVVYNVTFEYSYVNQEKLNETIEKLIRVFESKNEKWVDELPISLEMPFSFAGGAETEVAKLKEKIDMNTYATAENCMVWLYRRYGIKKYKNEDGECTHCGKEYDECTFTDYDDATARKIAGVRYSMLLSDFSQYNGTYTFASDISQEMVALLRERSQEFTGLQISQTAQRTYISGDVASHLIGRVGKITEETWEEYKALGYSMADMVGIGGIEEVMESRLKGTDGEKTISINKNGDVIGETVTKEAVKGETIQLSIDYYFQKEVQQVVIDWMNNYNQNEGKEESARVESGAVVVLNPKTGAVLASVSLPTYDINEMINSYSTVANAKNTPLLNRAMNGYYRPGSTFKPIVGTAGLMEGIITTSSTVYCGHVYTYYPDYPATCLNSGHRNQNMNITNSLRTSCNIFFYDVGRRLGIQKVNEYANYFGMAVDTGLELNVGSLSHLSSPEFSESLGSEWYPGNIIQASIGQLDTAITPLQMACEAMTLANRGTRYETHLIDGYIDSDGNVTKKDPVVASEIEIPENYFEAMVEGMNHVADGLAGTQYSVSNLGYNVAVKTGSPQTSTTASNHAYISFGPSEDAEICIASMMENSLPRSTRMIRGIYKAWETAKAREAELKEYYLGLLKGDVIGEPSFSWDTDNALSSSDSSSALDETSSVSAAPTAALGSIPATQANEEAERATVRIIVDATVAPAPASKERTIAQQPQTA